MTCFYTIDGLTLTGPAEFKAYLVDGGLDKLFPDGKYPWEQEAAEPTKSLLDTHAEITKRIISGDITAEQLKADFEALVSNADAVMGGLSKLTKDQLKSRIKGYYRPDAKKQDLIEDVYEGMLTDFRLSNEVFSYSVDYMNKEKAAVAIARKVRKELSGITDTDIKQYADSIKQQEEVRLNKVKAAVEGMKNPTTIADFNGLVKAKMDEGMPFTEARMLALTPEQRERYDELMAEKSRDERKARADQQKTDIRATTTTTIGDIVETKHTKTGEDLFVVKTADRVERDIYNQWLATAKRMGGWYSSYRGSGAVPGFQFKTRENAEAFLQYLGGDTEQAKQVVQERRDAYADDRNQTAVERLNEMAERLEERGTASLNQERKANTQRRAGMAARAEAAAQADIALAKTMRNIAGAIDNNKAKFLDRVRQKTQVEMLQGFVSAAQYDKLRKLYPNYGDYEKHQGEAPTNETADYAQFPSYTVYRSDLASLGRSLLETDGTKKLGQQLMSVADDVSDVYLKFAKDNIDKVSVFRTGNGDKAAFSSKSNAEEAIRRSGYKGAAIALPVKRGENLIVLSPSEAIKRGVWKGDNDKRITLSNSFGAELVEKIGKASRRSNKVSVPWQLENNYDKQKRLSAMGIETPAELRAALREFIGLREAPKEADKIKEMERAMIGRANDGLDFFPTPAGIADEMIDAADIKEGMSILEPSAGMGHIAERIREAGIEPDVVELSNSRKELLEAKGFNVVGRDFMDVNGSYDRVIMNPPFGPSFGDRRDALHVQHAYDLLKPGGRLVAIMSEGVFFSSDKKAQAFRDWLERVGGTEEKLAEGTFLDSSLPVNTGVNARLVVIDKPENDIKFSKSNDDMDFAHEVLSELAEIDEIFRYPVSKAATLPEVMKDIAPGFKYIGEDDQLDPQEDFGADKKLLFRNEKGKRFDVYVRGDELWIDVSHFDTGERGSAVYAAIGNYAYNTGKVFIADPHSLSDDAAIRRTSAMLSLALRFGTTDFMEPGPKQLKGIPELGVKPLKWSGSDVDRTRSLIDTFLSNLEHSFPELNNVRYDFNRRQFVNVSTGEPIDISVFSSLRRSAYAGVAGAARAGEATTRRGAFIRSLISSESSERPGILEQVLNRASSLVKNGNLSGMFSTSQSSVQNPHTEQSLTQAIRKTLDAKFGEGWTNRLLATGKFKVINNEEADKLINGETLFSKSSKSAIDKINSHYDALIQKKLNLIDDLVKDINARFTKGNFEYKGVSLPFNGDFLKPTERRGVDVVSALSTSSYWTKDGEWITSDISLRQLLKNNGLSEYDEYNAKYSDASTYKGMLGEFESLHKKIKEAQELIKNHNSSRIREISDYKEKEAKKVQLEKFKKLSKSLGYLYDVWSSIADNENAFYYGNSESSDIETIADDMTHGAVKVESESYDKIILSTKNGSIVIRKTDTNIPYIQAINAGSNKVKQGGGTALYQVALTWAHNNNKTMRGDPDGLTSVNVLRRTENMIASALRHGTTKHLRPHSVQKEEGLQWKGSDEQKIALMLAFSNDIVFDSVPELKGIVFSPGTGKFTLNGKEISDEDIEEKIVASDQARKVGVGLSTAKRAIITYSALQELHDGKLEKLLPDEFGRLAPKPILYSNEGLIKGFYNPANDTSYFVYDNISKDTYAKSLYGLMLHEVSVHQLNLLRNDKDFQRILQQVKVMSRGGKMKEAAARVPKDTKPEHYWEEVLSYFLEYNSQHSIAQKVIALYRKALRALGRALPILERTKHIKWANSLSEGDIISMATSALRQAPDALAFDNQASDKSIRNSFAGPKANTADNSPSSTDTERNAANDNVNDDIDTWSGSAYDYIDNDAFKVGTINKKLEAMIAQYANVEGKPRREALAEAVNQYRLAEIRYFNKDGSPKAGAMLAPNGKPTNLTEQQWLQSKTSNFRKWFGKSSHVDENSEPLVINNGNDEVFVNNVGQEKSATGNTGTFNPDSNDIRFSISRPADLWDDAAAIPKSTLQDISEKLKNSVDKGRIKSKKLFLSGLTQRQLTQIGEEILPILKQFGIERNHYDTTEAQWHSLADGIAKQWERLAQNYKPLSNAWQTRNKIEQMRLAEVMDEMTVSGMDPRLARQNKWNPAQYNELKARYDKLLPNTKALLGDVEQFHKSASKELIRSLTDKIMNTEMPSENKDKLIKEIENKFKLQKGPYFPLMRFGDYWVDYDGGVQMFETEREQKAFRKQMQKEGATVNGFGKSLKNFNKVEGVDAGFVDQVNQLIDTLDVDQADQLKDGIFQLYLTALPETSMRKRFIHRKKTPGWEKDALRSFAKKAFHDGKQLAKLKYAPKMRQVLKDAEEIVKIGNSSKRKAALERRIDFIPKLQAFLDNADKAPFDRTEYADAIEEFDTDEDKELIRRFDRLKDDKERNEVMNQYLDKQKALLKAVNDYQAKGDKSETMTDILEALNASYANMMSSNISSVANLINQGVFTYFMGFNPASAVLNYFQTPGVALPLVAGKHGFGKASHALVKATKDFFSNQDTDGFSIGPGLTNAGERLMFEALTNNGTFDRTRSHDLIGLSEEGIARGTLHRDFMMASTFMFHKAEIANREITALMAYRLEFAKTGNVEKSIEYANRIVNDAHLDYSSANRPDLFQGNFARVALQFKMYSQGMTYLWGKQFYDSFFNKDASAERKAEARNIFYSMIGVQVAFAGALGLPIGGILMAAQLLAGLGDDDDDPVNVEIEIRKALSNVFGDDIGRLLSKGTLNELTGADFSSRLSLSDLWIREPDKELEGKDEAYYLLKTVLGPAAGILEDVLVGMKLIGDGNAERGIEKMLPHSVAGMAKSYRMASEGGATSMTGNMIYETNAWEKALQALGMRPSGLSERQLQNSAIKNREMAITETKSKLVSKAAKARIDGDSAKFKELMTGDIAEFNRKYPKLRINNKTILKSIKARKAAQHNAKEGLVVKRKFEFVRGKEAF